MPVKYEFGLMLAEKMNKMGFIPEDVAARSGLTPERYNKIIDSVIIPTYEEAQLIATSGLHIEKDAPEYLGLLKARVRDKIIEKEDPIRRRNLLTLGVTCYSVDRDGNVTLYIGIVPLVTEARVRGNSQRLHQESADTEHELLFLS